MGELLMTKEQLLEAVSGSCLCDCSIENGFTSVVTDSRNVLPGSLFIPLMGDRQDGHVYIPQALTAGARIVLIDSAHADGSASLFFSLAKQYHACFIVVAHTMKALQDAARSYVNSFPKLMKVGVTGSSGKTTTKELLGAILSQKYSVIQNEGNLNSETGLPLSVFRIRPEHEVGIFEMGMNRHGEIDEIARVLSPRFAVITNIGTAHIGILGSKDAIAKEKKSIFNYFSANCVGYVPEDDQYAPYLSSIPNGVVKTFGRTSLEGIENIQDLGLEGSLIVYKGRTIRFPLPGSYNLTNALGAMMVAEDMGCTTEQIGRGLESVKSLFGRAEIIRGPVTILQDCYNANPQSMEKAIEFCSSLEWQGEKHFILGSMLELGESSFDAHRKICSIAALADAQTVFLFGDDMIHAGYSVAWNNASVYFAPSMDELKQAVRRLVKPGDFVFIKGSRGMALERVVPVITDISSEIAT